MRLSNALCVIGSCLLLLVLSCSAPEKKLEKERRSLRKQFIDSLISEMTIEEKIGQLNYYKGDAISTGPKVGESDTQEFDELIRKGEITGLFNTYGAEYTRRFQQMAIEESRLGIPLLFGADIIHGFKTIFPIPLATAASWDLDAIEKAERVAAQESTSVGITLNFAPMVDVTRDPRWGRVAEGAGEDPFLGSRIAAARVRGLQGDTLSANSTMAACIKHFAAYGAPHGGRDYNTVDISSRLMREVYLPPYRAGINAGAAVVMTSFNDINGVPVSGSKRMLKQILRGEWGFKGMVLSDWNSIGEMINHGYAAGGYDAARLAIEAGVDMDMMSDLYRKHLPAFVASEKTNRQLLDDAVSRVLRLKWDLGLFDNPYKYSDSLRQQSEIRTEENIAFARDVAKKSIVLLKNKNQLLPLSKTGLRIGVIGPLADSHQDMNGTWAFFGESSHTVTYLDGIKAAVGEQNVEYASGSPMYGEDDQLRREAIRVARRSDVVVMVLGESAVMNGEGASRSSIDIPENQRNLMRGVVSTGTPVVLLVMTGRPLDLSWEAENVQSILCVWTLGSESGNAAADVLFGDYNPSAKLPISFPRSVGQIPVYYNHPNTGRPYDGDYEEQPNERVYKSKYRDIENSPLFPFGYGLSYTTFEYDNLSLNADTLRLGESIEASVTVTNSGDVAGKEIVQFYIRDVVGSVVRPVKELKGFRKVSLKPGESKEVSFRIRPETVSFFHENLEFKPEPGDIRVFIGGSSQTDEYVTFYNKSN